MITVCQRKERAEGPSSQGLCPGLGEVEVGDGEALLTSWLQGQPGMWPGMARGLCIAPAGHMALHVHITRASLLPWLLSLPRS